MTLSGLPGKAAFKVMVIFVVVKWGHVKTDKTGPVRVVMSSDLKTVQVSKYSGGGGRDTEKPGEVCCSFPLTLTLFITKIWDSPYPIYDSGRVQTYIAYQRWYTELWAEFDCENWDSVSSGSVGRFGKVSNEWLDSLWKDITTNFSNNPPSP